MLKASNLLVAPSSTAPPLLRLTLQAPPGSRVFLTGPSGSGKSSALRQIAALLPLPPGTSADALTLSFSTPADLSLPVWRTLVSYVPQARVTLPGSPADLLARAASFKSQAARNLDVGAAFEITTRELGVADIAHREWAELSGGEAQRCLVAVCIALKPQVLLCDEVTSALDEGSAAAVEKAVCESGAAVVWVSHSPDQVRRLATGVVEIGKLNGGSGFDFGGGGGGRAVLVALGAATVVGVAEGAREVYDMEDVSGFSLALASLTLLAVVGASWTLGLGLGKRVVVAGCRAALQLTLLGWVLVPVFAADSGIVVLGFIAVATAVAAGEASRRTAYVVDGQFAIVGGCIAMAVVFMGWYGLFAVLGTGLEASYAIPIVGMLLGNSLSGVSVGLGTLLREFAPDRRGNVELLLALGATRAEAVVDPLRRAVTLGMTPTLQMLTVVGLVSIPGMMTGTISSF